MVCGEKERNGDLFLILTILFFSWLYNDFQKQLSRLFSCPASLGTTRHYLISVFHSHQNTGPLAMIPIRAKASWPDEKESGAVFLCDIMVRRVLQKGNGKLGIRVGVFIFIECIFGIKMSEYCSIKCRRHSIGIDRHVSNLSTMLNSAVPMMKPYRSELSN